MSEVTLDEFLTLRGVDVSNAYLHIIREPNATRDWRLARNEPDAVAALFDVALADTAHNNASAWRGDRPIAVLIDTGVAASGMDHIEGAYLLLGVLEVVGRREGCEASELLQRGERVLSTARTKGNFANKGVM